MVHCDDGRVSLSCCVYRDQVGRLRAGDGQVPGGGAGAHCRCLCRRPASRWPGRNAARVAGDGTDSLGIRASARGLFQVGNTAGERTRSLRKGSAWHSRSRGCWRRSWKALAARRGRAGAGEVGSLCHALASEFFAGCGRRQRLAMRPRAAPVLPWRCFPALLDGVGLSGKATQVVAGLEGMRFFRGLPQKK